MDTADPKPMRADARRNRELVLAAAVRAFADRGTAVSLDAVAAEAGVGVGTLYRHFPTRDALVEAVYREEVERLHSGASALLAEHAPADALAAWMDLFVGYAERKRGLKEALQAAVAAGGESTFAETRARIVDAVALLLDAAQRDGTVRRDVEAEDVLLATGGLWQMPAGPDWDVRARRLLGLVLDGLRVSPTG